jgi:DNA-binding winged helix-turn-helix (wHTH) protein
MEYNHLEFNLENCVSFLPGKGHLVNDQGNIVSLTENSLRFLMLLLDGVTEKEQIIEKVWREQKGAISESSYYGQLHILRNSFEQIGLDKNLIKTIPRKGVRYIGQFEKREYKGKQVDSPDLPATHQEQDMVLQISEQVDLLADKMEASIAPSPKSLRLRLLDNIQEIRPWNLFISFMSIVSVCWLTLLTFLLLSKVAE